MACSYCVSRSGLGKPFDLGGVRAVLNDTFVAYQSLTVKHSLTKAGGFIQSFLSFKDFNKVVYRSDQKKLFSTEAQILVLQLFAGGFLESHVHDKDLYARPVVNPSTNRPLYLENVPQWHLLPLLTT